MAFVLSQWSIAEAFFQQLGVSHVVLGQNGQNERAPFFQQESVQLALSPSP